MQYFCLLIAFCAVAVIADDAPQEQQAPPFLNGATPDQVKQFYDLLKQDETKTDPQIDADISNFVAGLGGNFQQQFDDFKAQLKAGQADFDNAHSAAIANFSPAAKEADSQMTKIADDPTLNGVQKREQIKAIMDALPDNIRAEIVTALNQS